MRKFPTTVMNIIMTLTRCVFICKTSLNGTTRDLHDAVRCGSC